MKIVTAFDLGVLIARSNFVKSAENPLVRVAAQHARDNNAQGMNAYQQNKNRPAPLNIPGAAANAFSGLGSAIQGGAQMAASPPQLPSWALNYKFNAPQTATVAAPSRSTSSQPLPSFGAGGDPLNPNPAPQIDPARAAVNAYHQNKALQRASAGILQPTNLNNPVNAYHVRRIQAAAGFDALNPNPATKAPDLARAANNAYHQNLALQKAQGLANANNLAIAR